MSEMLGNQYFMARNYSAAETEFEECLGKNPDNKSVLKKLIVCYTQSNKLNIALDLFMNLVKDDIEYIVKTNFIDDDCPCPELIHKIENSHNYTPDSVEYFTMLGIIWLYCNIEKSIDNFEKAKTFAEANPNISNILIHIKNHFERIKATS